MIYWVSQQYDYLSYFDGNNYTYPQKAFSNLLFAGNKKINEDDLWNEQLNLVKIGIIGYDFKNSLESLSSKNSPIINLPDLCFFAAELCFCFEENYIKSKTKLTEEFWRKIKTIELPDDKIKCELKAQITKREYIKSVETIQKYIREGDTYEMNFCQAFEGSFTIWDPIASFFKLQKISPMPFASLFKAEDKWLISASPERFLKKENSRLIAQPIKGTIQRGGTEIDDEVNKKSLLTSEKERAENLMITDLTRNDLSKISEIGSVKVEELFGIYSLPKVFQMITTISSILKPDTTFKKIIQATFPMGSMTGAPKIRTMELIDELESFKRNWFSGAFGWIDENGDFDFSVVIRSIIADLETKKLYFGVGSAITIDSDASKEYEECELKSQAILEVLNGRKKS
ncbi:anthranilate synthase component I family protein [Algoriphagus sp.]|uniref:anthranilate synthase component I family protein n=1 Tax=Algoriphagus sp. TaxID=1872435 RepID=UPI0025CC2FDE|nr:anthranilate synthase component I family protein [Algoriphagus sp.]